MTVTAAAGQTSAPSGGTDKSLWLSYFGDQPFTRNLSMHLEGSYRRTLDLADFEQLMLRPGLTVVESKHTQSLVAYTFFLSKPTDGGSFGPPPATGRQVEHRSFEQQIFEHRIYGEGERTATLAHRVRVEQRWIGTALENGRDDWRFSERARYRLTAHLPFERRNYIAVFNEVYTSFGSHGSSGPLISDATYIAHGRPLSRYWTLEVGYQFRSQEAPSGITGVHDHSLQIYLLSKKPLRDVQP